MIKMCLFDRSINGMIVNALKQLLNRRDREKVFADILGHARRSIYSTRLAMRRCGFVVAILLHIFSWLLSETDCVCERAKLVHFLIIDSKLNNQRIHQESCKSNCAPGRIALEHQSVKNTQSVRGDKVGRPTLPSTNPGRKYPTCPPPIRNRPMTNTV